MGSLIDEIDEYFLDVHKGFGEVWQKVGVNKNYLVKTCKYLSHTIGIAHTLSFSSPFGMTSVFLEYINSRKKKRAEQIEERYKKEIISDDFRKFLNFTTIYTFGVLLTPVGIGKTIKSYLIENHELIEGTNLTEDTLLFNLGLFSLSLGLNLFLYSTGDYFERAEIPSGSLEKKIEE